MKGSDIKKYLIENGIKQSYLSEKTGIPSPILNMILAMSKTPHTQYLCMFARHGNLFYHSKFIVTTSSKWYN